MAVLGSPNYKVGLIISDSQPFNNGDLRIITDALMYCDEVIFSIKNYDTAFFDYNIAQQLFRKLYKLVDRVAFFGTEFDPLLGTPKHYIIRTLEKLEDAKYHMPTHFFTTNPLWVDGAVESQLITTQLPKLFGHDPMEILQSIGDGTELWKEKVPYSLIEDIATYTVTKNNLLNSAS